MHTGKRKKQIKAAVVFIYKADSNPRCLTLKENYH